MEHNGNIELKLSGENVSPETMSITELLDLIQNFDSIILETAEKEVDNDELEKMSFSLVGISKGSAIYSFHTTNAQVTKSFKMVALTIQDKKLDRLPNKTIPKIEKIIQFKNKKKLNLTISIKNDDTNSNGEIIKEELSGNFEIGLEDIKKATQNDIYIFEEDSLYGEIRRIGGDKPKIWLRTNHKNIHCTVDNDDEEIIKLLANNLYKEVGVVGIAKWNITKGELQEFKITEVLDYESIDMQQSIKEIKEVVGNGWDNLDVNEFMSSLRH